MSRKYNVSNRLAKAYENYLKQFAKRSSAQIAKGYQIVAPKALSFNEYKASRIVQKNLGVASGNITKTIISQQIYEFSQAQAEDLYNALGELGIINEDDMTIYGTKVTLEALKSKGGLGKEALSLINDRLKELGWSGYERANWITERIYEDSD